MRNPRAPPGPSPGRRRCLATDARGPVPWSPLHLERDLDDHAWVEGEVVRRDELHAQHMKPGLDGLERRGGGEVHRFDLIVEIEMEVPLVGPDVRRRRGDDRGVLQPDPHWDDGPVDHLAVRRRDDLHLRGTARPGGRWAGWAA